MKFGEERRYMELSLTNVMPTAEQIVEIETVRSSAKMFLGNIFDHCPDSAERTIALRKLEECVHYCVKSIILEGK